MDATRAYGLMMTLEMGSVGKKSMLQFMKIFFALELSRIMTPLKAAYRFAHTLTLRSSISPLNTFNLVL
jgi:hypothetical protein